MLHERRQEFIPPEMWPSNSPDLSPVDYSIWGILQEKIHRSQIHDVKELKKRLLSEWRLLDHTIITAAIAQWCIRLNACVRVNGGHFEHKFWAFDFLLCFVCFIDTGSLKCDRYKHVQSVNIVWNVFSFVSAIFTRYGSDITNIWHEILTPMTLAFSCEDENLSIIVKVTAKKSVAPFYVDTVYIRCHRWQFINLKLRRMCLRSMLCLGIHNM